MYQALRERERLRKNAPHLVKVLPFMIPILTKDGVVSRKIARAMGSAMWMYDLTGGLRIAGTGTIDADGTVGAVGGVTLKTQAAKRDGATVFLVPKDECSEANGNLPKGLRLVPVSTLKGALSALRGLRTHGQVPHC